MSDDMNTKYQQHYNQILSGTLSDMLIKSVSYQANIKLANEIIAEQEKTIESFEEENEKLKSDLSEYKTIKVNSDNHKIVTLEKDILTQNETINRLNSEINSANKLKSDYENLKSQINNAETFRNELIKEREAHKSTKQDYEQLVNELKQKIDLLENPPKKKRIKSSPVLVNEQEQQATVSEDAVKDGGSF